jgi:hypothetical protein
MPERSHEVGGCTPSVALRRAADRRRPRAGQPRRRGAVAARRPDDIAADDSPTPDPREMDMPPSTGRAHLCALCAMAITTSATAFR